MSDREKAEYYRLLYLRILKKTGSGQTASDLIKWLQKNVSFSDLKKIAS